VIVQIYADDGEYYNYKNVRHESSSKCASNVIEMEEQEWCLWSQHKMTIDFYTFLVVWTILYFYIPLFMKYLTLAYLLDVDVNFMFI